MALACKCDRCGRYFSIPENGMIKKIIIGTVSPFQRVNDPINKHSYDMCDLCLNEFNLFMADFEKKSN